MSAEVLPQKTRIGAIDALRGFALIGIFFVNIVAMSGAIGAEAPASPPDATNADWQLWWVSNLFVHGAMRGLFSVLFGASTLLFLRETDRASAFVRRCGWLFVFGVVNSTLLLWPGDILMVYACAGPLLLCFRHARPAVLFAAAGVLITVLSAWSFADALAPTDPMDAAAQARDLAEEGAARLGSYLDTLAFMTRTASAWTFDLSFLWWVLDAAAFMLVGMGLYKLRLLDASANVRIYALVLAVGFGLGLPLRVWQSGTAFAHAGEFSPLAEMTFQLGRLLMTLGWLGAFMLAWKTIPWRMLFAPLSALGRMALTGYLAQSMAAAVLFSGFGLGAWNRLGWPALWMLVLVVMAGISLFALAWLSRFRVGPVEWAWRTLTFGKPSPLRI